MPRPPGPRGGGGGGGGRPSGLMAAKDTGPPARTAARPKDPPAISCRSLASPPMSSRTCAKPGCSTSAAATLTYDYANRTAWVELLNDEAHPMRYDLCGEHADALTVPNG